MNWLNMGYWWMVFLMYFFGFPVQPQSSNPHLTSDLKNRRYFNCANDFQKRCFGSTWNLLSPDPRLLTGLVTLVLAITMLWMSDWHAKMTQDHIQTFLDLTYHLKIIKNPPLSKLGLGAMYLRKIDERNDWTCAPYKLGLIAALVQGNFFSGKPASLLTVWSGSWSHWHL